MFHDVIFCLEILFTYITITFILGEYPCGKEILDILYKCKVTDSADGSSQNNAGSALIGHEALRRPACHSSSEEQRWLPTLYVAENIILTLPKLLSYIFTA